MSHSVQLKPRPLRNPGLFFEVEAEVEHLTSKASCTTPLSISSAGRAIKTVAHLLLLEAEGCLIEEKRVAVKASTGPKCGALR